MLNWLKGKKTYIVAALALAVNLLYMAGQITSELRDELLKLLGAGAIATVAAKINRLSNR